MTNVDITTQINFRLPTEVKVKAMEKAISIGTTLNHIIKLFLVKFITDDNVAKIQYDFDFDALFDLALIDYSKSVEGKEKAKSMMRSLQEQGII